MTTTWAACGSTCRARFWTFLIGTAGPGRHLPARRLLVEGRDPRRRRQQGQAATAYTLMLVIGLIGAFLHRGLHDPGLLVPDLLRRVPRPRPPRTSRPTVITVPLVILGGRSPSSSASSNLPGLVQRPVLGRRPASSTSSSRPFAFPDGRAPRVQPWLAGARLDRARRSPASCIAYALLLPKRLGAPRPHRAQRGSPAPGYTFLENKYYLDYLYTDVIVAGIKGPIARAAYWFNQNVHRRRRQRRRRAAPCGVGQFVYDDVDQEVVDGVVNGSGAGLGGIRPGPAPHADRQGPAVRRAPLRRRGRPRPACSS